MSDERIAEIDKRIDRDIAGAVALSTHPSVPSVIVPKNLEEIMQFAKLMAVSGPCVRPVFRGNPGACLAIALQAFRTGADPFAVANKAYITTSRSGDEQIAYEAQYIHAVLNTSGKLAKRLRPKYSGDGQSRKCEIIGHVVGEDEPLEYESPTIGEIAVKNSPLWKGDPDQQLFYYSSRAWGRRHLPEVLLGMYTPDEIRGEVIDVTPTPPPPRPLPEDYAEHGAGLEQEPDDGRTVEAGGDEFEVVTPSSGELRQHATAEDARNDILDQMTAARSEPELTGIWESNAGTVRAIGEAIEDGDEPLNQVYEATKKGFQPLAGKSGQTEHPEGRQPTPVPERRQPDPTSPQTEAAARDEPRRTAELGQKIEAAETDQQLVYWTREALAECRAAVETEDLWRKHNKRYLRASIKMQKEIKDMINERSLELQV